MEFLQLLGGRVFEVSDWRWIDNAFGLFHFCIGLNNIIVLDTGMRLAVTWIVSCAQCSSKFSLLSNDSRTRNFR